MCRWQRYCFRGRAEPSVCNGKLGCLWNVAVWCWRRLHFCSPHRCCSVSSDWLRSNVMPPKCGWEPLARPLLLLFPIENSFWQMHFLGGRHLLKNVSLWCLPGNALNLKLVSVGYWRECEIWSQTKPDVDLSPICPFPAVQFMHVPVIQASYLPTRSLPHKVSWHIVNAQQMLLKRINVWTLNFKPRKTISYLVRFLTRVFHCLLKLPNTFTSYLPCIYEELHFHHTFTK